MDCALYRKSMYFAKAPVSLICVANADVTISACLLRSCNITTRRLRERDHEFTSELIPLVSDSNLRGQPSPTSLGQSPTIALTRTRMVAREVRSMEQTQTARIRLPLLLIAGGIAGIALWGAGIFSGPVGAQSDEGTPTPTATADTDTTATPSTTPSTTPSATPSTTATATQTGTATPEGTETATPTLTATAAPSQTATTQPATATATRTTVVPTSQPPNIVTATAQPVSPPSTGDAGLLGGNSAPEAALWFASIAAIGVGGLLLARNLKSDSRR